VTTNELPSRRRNRRGEGTLLRDELLSAALRVLEDPENEGRLSVRAVAAEAGVAPQSVYLQFPDAAALRWAAFARMFDVLAADLDAATGKAPDSVAALHAWATAYVSFALGNPGRFQAMFGAVGERQPEWGFEDLPGSTVFDGLQALVSTVGDSQSPSDESFTEALCLWAALHGLASLRISKPSFPWPPIELLIGRVLVRQIWPMQQF
jgi:AcrR family transcriptional regulator